MARVKRGTKRTDRRKKILDRAKGFYGTHSKSHRIAKQAVDKALSYAYRDRRQKKRHLRALWIVRINAAARLHGLSYSRLISGLKAAGSLLDRLVAHVAAVLRAFGSRLPNQRLPFAVAPQTVGARGSDVIIEGITYGVTIELDGFKQS